MSDNESSIRDLINDRLENAERERKAVKPSWWNNAKKKELREQNITPIYIQQVEESKLTPEQIHHWRNVIGPFSVFLSDDEIQAYRDRMQYLANRMAI
jgi:hypothetical protein